MVFSGRIRSTILDTNVSVKITNPNSPRNGDKTCHLGALHSGKVGRFTFGMLVSQDMMTPLTNCRIDDTKVMFTRSRFPKTFGRVVLVDCSIQ